LLKIQPIKSLITQGNVICFELNRCEVTWSSVKSFGDLYKQTQVLLLSPVFFVSGFQ